MITIRERVVTAGGAKKRRHRKVEEINPFDRSIIYKIIILLLLSVSARWVFRRDSRWESMQ